MYAVYVQIYSLLAMLVSHDRPYFNWNRLNIVRLILKNKYQQSFLPVTMTSERTATSAGESTT